MTSGKWYSFSRDVSRAKENDGLFKKIEMLGVLL